jgi:hypothetical protein
METEVSLHCSQESATELYPEPDESSLHPHILFFLKPILLSQEHHNFKW